MKTFILILSTIFVLLVSCETTTKVTNFTECVQAGNLVMKSYPRQCRHEDQTFTEIIEMNIDDALQIAKFSECIEKGSLTDEYFFNENSNTWWINLKMKEKFNKEGCNPACVVNAVTKEAEINWRCTGLITK